MRRMTLLVGSILLLCAIPSFAAITFYSSSSSWLAARNATSPVLPKAPG